MHIGTNKVQIILPTSKTNHTTTAQHVTINASSTACPVKAITAYTSIHPKRPGQFFIQLSGNPVLTPRYCIHFEQVVSFPGPAAVAH